MRATFFPIIVIVAVTNLLAGCAFHRLPKLEDEYRLLVQTGEPNSKAQARRFAVAERFSPVLRHGNNHSWWVPWQKDLHDRMNFVTRFDYDGDMNTANNQNNLLKKHNGSYHELEATLYFAVVETKTHYFITYHFYHAMDRSKYIPNVFWLWASSHENDGENIQVVVRKGNTADGDYLELAAVESHNNVKLYLGSSSKLKCSRDLPRLKQVKDATHPCIYVGSGKHPLSVDKKPDGKGIRFAVRTGRKPCDRWQSGKADYAYALRPVCRDMWLPFVRGQHMGEKGIFEGAFTYVDKPRKFTYARVPRHYNSNRMSSILFGFKCNSGILPFAFDLPHSTPKTGRLFFSPATGYKEYLGLSGDWSTTYSYNPYLPSN